MTFDGWDLLRLCGLVLLIWGIVHQYRRGLHLSRARQRARTRLTQVCARKADIIRFPVERRVS